MKKYAQIAAGGLFALLCAATWAQEVAVSFGVDDRAIAAAVANPARPAEDRADDPNRKPAQVLAFFGIRPGMTVLDVFSGGGYYSELLNHLVGDRGQVVAHNNRAYETTLGPEALALRYGNRRLPNVTKLVAEANELTFEPNQFDAILMIRTYHDIYFTPATGWVIIDGPKLLAELHTALKPGGVLGVIDHWAQAGAPTTSGNDLHRIDPAIVRAELAAAGFTFEAAAGFLHNHNDDLTKPMFDEAIRGKTHRFVHRYRKPQPRL